jgi:transposase
VTFKYKPIIAFFLKIQTSMETKIRNRFTIFITNIDSTKASINDIVLLYRLRWQVELCFKHWKSIYKIDDIPKMKKERFLCPMYAKLIVIVLNQQLIFGVRNLLHKHEKILFSIEKCIKTIKEKSLSMYSAFRAKKKMSVLKLYIISLLYLRKIIG